MFEPKDPRPMDPPEAFVLPDGKEEWIAEKAMEIRCDSDLMHDALEWDGDQSGNADVLYVVSAWMQARSHYDDSGRETANRDLWEVLMEVAERYAEYVLLPAHIEKMKKGDFCG